MYFIFIFIFVFFFLGGEGFLVRAIEYIASPDVNTNKGVGEMATSGAVSANPLLLLHLGTRLTKLLKISTKEVSNY